MYLIRLVIVLRVVLEHFLLLLELPGGHELIELDLLPPVLAVDEPRRVNVGSG